MGRGSTAQQWARAGISNVDGVRLENRYRSRPMGPTCNDATINHALPRPHETEAISRDSLNNRKLPCQTLPVRHQLRQHAALPWLRNRAIVDSSAWAILELDFAAGRPGLNTDFKKAA
jgi:hypothetical protein